MTCAATVHAESDSWTTCACGRPCTACTAESDWNRTLHLFGKMPCNVASPPGSHHTCAAALAQAKKYDEWSEAARLGAADRYTGLALNGWTGLVAGRLEEARRRGPACFDRSFYTSANQFDLGFIDSQPDPQARPLCLQIFFLGSTKLYSLDS